MAIRLTVLSALLMLVVAACGFTNPPATQVPIPVWPTLVPGAKVLNLDIVGRRAREQRSAEIVLGTTVIWTHDTTQLHNVRHTPHITGDSQAFKSGNFDRGEDFQYTFDKLGRFSYFCEVHAGHGTATIWVVEEKDIGTSPLDEDCTGTVIDQDDAKVCIPELKT